MNRRFRLTRSTDFKRVRRIGKSYAHPLVVFVAAPNELQQVRIGVVAGRAVGSAVQRNRAKRQLRACLQQWLACLPGGDATAAEAALADAGSTLAGGAAAQVCLLLWTATHDRAHLVEAKRHLDFMVEHAPPEFRESMLANVRLHREIVAACKAEGID